MLLRRNSRLVALKYGWDANDKSDGSSFDHLLCCQLAYSMFS